MDKEDWYINIMEYYSVIKKDGVMPLAAIWMDLRDYYTGWSKSERERQIHNTTYMWNLKYDTNETYLQNRIIDIENKLTFTKGKNEWRREKLGVWD